MLSAETPTVDFSGPFTDAVRANHEQLLGSAISKVGRKDGEDVLQETYLSAWKARENLPSPSDTLKWLRAILKNRITDEYRRRNSQLRTVTTSVDCPDELFEASKYEVDPVHILGNREMIGALAGMKSKTGSPRNAEILIGSATLSERDAWRVLGFKKPASYSEALSRAKVAARCMLTQEGHSLDEAA